jgi:hypothetical protein
MATTIAIWRTEEKIRAKVSSFLPMAWKMHPKRDWAMMANPLIGACGGHFAVFIAPWKFRRPGIEGTRRKCETPEVWKVHFPKKRHHAESR